MEIRSKRRVQSILIQDHATVTFLPRRRLGLASNSSLARTVRPADVTPLSSSQAQNVSVGANSRTTSKINDELASVARSVRSLAPAQPFSPRADLTVSCEQIAEAEVAFAN